MPFIHGEPPDVTDEFAVNEDSYQHMTDWSVHLTNQTIEKEDSTPVYRYEMSGDHENQIETSGSLDGPMDSAWPMYCHDSHHTGQSPYSTVNTTSVEKWRTKFGYYVEGCPTIDTNGIIYVGANGLSAIYPNGTIKWSVPYLHIISAPTINEDGTVYVGTIYAMPNYLYAFYPNGTLKWRYLTGDSIFSSPVIDDNGTIFFGQSSGATGYIKALYPNGTLRWAYHTNGVVYSSPALGDDGFLYCGSHDNGLYALYPDNGTLKWRFGTGGWIRTAPCIAVDGTIYCVSLDNYLYALHPNGTMKWRTNVNAGTSPTIGQDGTIYCGWDHLYAINPTNGSVIWVFNPGGHIEGGTPCHSLDNIIYFGTTDGEIIAVNSNGTERWRKLIGNVEVQSAPAIGEDGTVYIGSSSFDAIHGVDFGYLYAFGPLDPNAPVAPTITGKTNGRIKRTYEYTFTSASLLGKQIYYLLDWGDGTTTDWLGPYPSGETITIKHSWSTQGTYNITARAKDTENRWGPWGELEVTMPYTYGPPHFHFIEWLLEWFPNAFPVLRYLLEK